MGNDFQNLIEEKNKITVKKSVDSENFDNKILLKCTNCRHSASGIIANHKSVRVLIGHMRVHNMFLASRLIYMPSVGLRGVRFYDCLQRSADRTTVTVQLLLNRSISQWSVIKLHGMELIKDSNNISIAAI